MGSWSFLPQQDFDPPVFRCIWIVGSLKMVVGMTLDVFNALLAHASTRQHVKSHVRARRRQPPIVVNRRTIRTSIGMTADDDGTRAGLQNLADLFHDLNGFWLRFGGT